MPPRHVLEHHQRALVQVPTHGSASGQHLEVHPLEDSQTPSLRLRPPSTVVFAAAFVVACYLSGARPGEILNLRPGCRDIDEATGELQIVGRRGKGPGRGALPDGPTPKDQRPWVVVTPVHTAIALLEGFGDYPFLFPSSLVMQQACRPNTQFARQAPMMNRDLEALLAWVNATFRGPGQEPPIPQDPTKHLHGSRFRRTLAYFIVRRPRGLVAAAIQYAHVHTKVTMNYAGRSDSTWMDDVYIETLEMVLDQNEHDARLLDQGEHVSGPSAEEHRRRVRQRAHFSGRVVTAPGSVSRLLDKVNPNIHHGQGMTCVWRAETAACRLAKIALGLPADDGPDESECRSTCVNLAFTDRNIAEKRVQLAIWDVSARDPLSPGPMRDRAEVIADGLRREITAHEASTPTSTTSRSQ